MVVMTTYGRSGLGRVLLGSVAESVLRSTAMPLLVLHPDGAPIQASRGQSRQAATGRASGRLTIRPRRAVTGDLRSPAAAHDVLIDLVRRHSRRVTIGRRILLYGGVPSTNLVLRDLTARGAVEGPLSSPRSRCTGAAATAGAGSRPPA